MEHGNVIGNDPSYLYHQLCSESYAPLTRKTNRLCVFLFAYLLAKILNFKQNFAGESVTQFVNTNSKKDTFVFVWAHTSKLVRERRQRGKREFENVDCVFV